MLKKILIFLFISLSSLKAEIINDLEVVGNNRISIETIKVYGDIKFGNDYSSSDLNEILKNLYSTDFFENIELSITDNKLLINLKEYPIINSIIIEGEKSKRIKDLVLEKIQLKSKNSFISNKLNDDINLIKKIYALNGYNFARIDSKIEEFSNDRVNILFNINKGDKTYINKISFIGDKAIKDTTLRRIIVSEEKKFWKFLSKNTFFNQQNLELDKRLLINYYKSLGYYDAQVLSGNAEIKNNFTDLIFTINSGNRYKIKKISTNVSEIFDKKLFEPLSNEYVNLIGKYYSPFKVKKLLDYLDILIADNDLQFVEHSVNEIIDENSIDLQINIFEGSKEIVERIEIKGNSITEETVIRSELLLDEGDPFNKLKFEKSIARLKSRNLFGEVNTSVMDGSQKNYKVLEIAVEEKPTGEISAGAGVGTTGGSFQFAITENNWLGKGINLSASFNASSETLSGGLSLVDPNYNFSGNSLEYFVKNTKNDKKDSGYKNKIFTAGIGTNFEQYKDIYLSPNISFSYDDLEVTDNASNNLKKQKGAFSDLSFEYSVVSDKRDRVYGATDGYVINFTQTLPFYADAPYIKNSFSFNNYYAFTPNYIGAFKFYSSAINGIKNKDVRLSKRLGLSSSRIRGFEYGKIGPKDGSDYVGGNYAASTNFELNLPNLLPESTKIDVGLFLDFGNVWHVDYSDSIDNSNKIRSSAGINTNWLTPVGPMSFIFSTNLSKADTDVTESFNFRLGTTF